MSKYQVCPTCEGEGQSSAYLGAFTASEMEEQGPEFMEDYIAGRYDRPCDECQGRRVVTAEEHEDYLDDLADLRVRQYESGIY